MPFVKGDPRINRKGRPKNFDQIRALAQELSHEPARGPGKDGVPGELIIIDGHVATVAEVILRRWAQSKDPRLVIAFMEYAFGKPPTRQENLNLDLSTLTDEQLEMLAAGDEITDVLKRTTS